MSFISVKQVLDDSYKKKRDFNLFSISRPKISNNLISKHISSNFVTICMALKKKKNSKSETPSHGGTRIS